LIRNWPTLTTGSAAFAERKHYAEAEAMCRIALEKARAELGTDDPQAFTWWGELPSRPYMRARQTLGLVLWRQGRYRDASAEFQAMLSS
jgi:hypothetical protein